MSYELVNLTKGQYYKCNSWKENKISSLYQNGIWDVADMIVQGKHILTDIHDDFDEFDESNNVYYGRRAFVPVVFK